MPFLCPKIEKVRGIKVKENNNGFNVKEGRSNKQYINTNFDFIDALNRHADCETLGFYISFKRYINRKDNTKENQITYTQAYLQKQFNIGRTKYYRHLKILFNAGLCDVEKVVTVKFFVNYNLVGKENPLVEKSIVYFSTLENIDIPLKNNLENIINEYYPEIPKELIKIVEVGNNNNFIFHDYPPIDILESNNYEFIQYRDWDMEMNRFSKTPPSQNVKDPLLQNKKEAPSQNEKYPPSRNRKDNIIIELNNNIIEPSNAIINQSIENPANQENTNKNNKDRLTDIDIKIKEKGFINYNDLIYELRLEKDFYEYPISEWIDSFKKALWEMYYYENTKIRGKKVSQFDAIVKLQSLNIDMITTTIEKVIEKSKEEEIQYPIAFLKTAIFNEIDEFSARVQAQINYDFSDKKDKVKVKQYRKTRFHNFENRTDKYTAEELEDIFRRKREKDLQKYKKA